MGVFLSAGNKEGILVPSYILKDRSIAVLETIVEYLKENRGLNYHEIGLLLERDERTVWTAYNRVKRKRKKR